MILQTQPQFGKEEATALHDYIMSGGWCTEYTKTREFEEVIAQKLGVKHCSLTTS